MGTAAAAQHLLKEKAQMGEMVTNAQCRRTGDRVTVSCCVFSMPKVAIFSPFPEYQMRFYFNRELGECKYFFYGGCEGNAVEGKGRGGTAEEGNVNN
jgi:hypothetical protein